MHLLKQQQVMAKIPLPKFRKKFTVLFRLCVLPYYHVILWHCARVSSAT